jgi:predicted dehydrogenase
MSSGEWNRRTFVKAATAAAVPVALAAATARGASRRGLEPLTPPTVAGKPNSGPLKVGLIGCGGRGTGAAVQALRADKQASLWAMGDVFAERIDSSLKGISGEVSEAGDGHDAAAERVQVAPERRFVGFDAYQKVIDSGVDVVLLTSYPFFRPEHLKAAVAAGKHVFAEKPLAVDGPGLRSVLESVAIAKRNATALLVGFCWRYNDGMVGMFEQVNDGAVGDVTTVHTTYHTDTLSKRPRRDGWSDAEFQLRNWWHFTWLSGDHIVEQAVHSIDRLAWAMGDRMPARVNCLGGRAARSGPEHGNVYDHFAAVYEYPDGRRCFHTCRQIDGCPSDNTDYIYGTKGSAEVNGWVPTYVVRDPAGKEVWKYAGRTDRNMYQNEHDALFASIRSGKVINDGERGANSTLMALMARMSAYTGQTVTWEQAMGSKERLGPEKCEFGPLATPEVAVPGRTKLV